VKEIEALHQDFNVDLRVVPQASYGAAMVYFTGSKQHNIHLREIAQKKGLSVSEYGIKKQANKYDVTVLFTDFSPRWKWCNPLYMNLFQKKEGTRFQEDHHWMSLYFLTDLL